MKMVNMSPMKFMFDEVEFNNSFVDTVKLGKNPVSFAHKIEEVAERKNRNNARSITIGTTEDF